MYRELPAAEAVIQQCPNCQNELDMDEVEWKVCTNCGHRWETQEERVIGCGLAPILLVWSILDRFIDKAQEALSKFKKRE